MNFAKRFGMLAVAAVTLLATVATAVPASAASYCWNLPITRYTYRYIRVPAQTTYAKPTPQTTYAKLTPQTPAAKPEAEAPKTTDTSTTNTAGLTAAEQQMLDLVNSERTKAGLAPLKADLELTKLARMKSQDMINHNYFSHQSPTYGSPFDMMKQYGVTYRTAGENLAGNSSVQGAHTALMNSPGHRANILNGQFTHVGIGIVKGGPYGMMFTQMFVGR